MLILADFLDSLLRGAVLASLSLVLGSVAWGLWILRAPSGRAPAPSVRRCLGLLTTGAVALAVGQVALLGLKSHVLSVSLGRDALADFAGTQHFEAGAARALLALAMAGVGGMLWWGCGAARSSALARSSGAAMSGRRSGAGLSWAVMAFLACLIAASGAWLTHAAGRLEHRPLLMALTVVHQVCAAVWVGGLVQLLGLWRLARRDAEIDAAWPVLVGRFSRLALVAVAALVVVSVPLTWTYTGTIGGLVGTGYGSLVLTKAMLLAATLVLAAANFGAARRAGRGALRGRLPYLVEAEAILVVMMLFAATALSAQPPPADQSPAEQATVREVLEVFRPKIPSLHTPSVDTMRQERTVAAVGRERSREAYLWSNFSHNVAGLIVLGMSILALAGLVGRSAWSRYWPLGFVLLAAFIYLRAAANEGTWPFGTIPLWQIDAEGIQHRLAAILVLALGILEWRARSRQEAGGILPYIFPALAAAGAVLLLTHSHTAFQLKSSFLVQVTHTTMGALAGVLAAARWLDLRLARPARRIAEAAAGAALLAIALILVFYREANVILPPG